MKINFKGVLSLVVAAVLLSTSTKALAINPFDMYYMYRNAANTGATTSFVSILGSGASGILGLDGSTSLAKYMGFGNRISWNTGTNTINVDTSNIPQSDITGLSSSLSTMSSAIASKQDADACLTELSGMGSTGTPEALVSDGSGNCDGVSPAGFRSWAGLATVAATGDYNDLINKPTIPSGTAWGSITGTLSSQTDLATALSGKEPVITGSTSNKFWNGLKSFVSLVANDISDATTVGKNVLTASTASDARTAIGAGTSNFDGQYSSLTGKPTLFSGAYADLTGKPTLFSGAYADLTGKPTIPTKTSDLTNDSGFITSVPAQSFASLTGKPTTLSGYGITDATSNARSAITLTTTGTGAATYNSSTGTLNVPTPAAVVSRSFAYPTRTLNTAYQVSTTRDAFVSYTVDVSASISLTAGQSGTVVLETADDSGFTVNVQTIQSAINGNTGTLTIGLALTQTSSASITGMVPAGKYVRIRTVNTSGSPTFTFRAAQEVLL